MPLQNNNLLEFEGFVIDRSKGVLWFEDEIVNLTPKVFETLLLFVENSGQLMSKEELIENLWADTFVEERNLTQNIFVLRKVFEEKLGKPGKKIIKTIPKKGYQFIADVQPVVYEEESLSVTHSKQLHITAEGYASQQELTDAVNKIAFGQTASIN